MGDCQPSSSHSQQGSQVVNTRYKDLHLFGFWRSSSTWRVRISLAAKNLQFQYHSIDILNGVSKTEDFANNRNSMKQIPVFEFIDSHTNPADGKRVRITQSLAIIEFIEEAFSDIGDSLLPQDFVDRARVREIAEIVNSGIQPLQNLSVMDMIDDFGNGLVETKLGNGQCFGKYHIENGLKAIERLVLKYRKEKNDPGLFAIGTSSPTLADAFIVPQMYNARRFFVDLENVCPTLLKVESHCLNHIWFMGSHPDIVESR